MSGSSTLNEAAAGILVEFNRHEAERHEQGYARRALAEAAPVLASLQRKVAAARGLELASNTTPAIGVLDAMRWVRAASKQTPNDIGLSRCATHLTIIHRRTPESCLSVGDVVKVREHFMSQAPGSKLASVLQEGLLKFGTGTLPMGELQRVASTIDCSSEQAYQESFRQACETNGLVNNDLATIRARAALEGIVRASMDREAAPKWLQNLGLATGLMAGGVGAMPSAQAGDVGSPPVATAPAGIEKAPYSKNDKVNDRAGPAVRDSKEEKTLAALKQQVRQMFQQHSGDPKRRERFQEGMQFGADADYDQKAYHARLTELTGLTGRVYGSETQPTEADAFRDGFKCGQLHFQIQKLENMLPAGTKRGQLELTTGLPPEDTMDAPSELEFAPGSELNHEQDIPHAEEEEGVVEEVESPYTGEPMVVELERAREPALPEPELPPSEAPLELPSGDEAVPPEGMRGASLSYFGQLDDFGPHEPAIEDETTGEPLSVDPSMPIPEEEGAVSVTMDDPTTPKDRPKKVEVTIKPVVDEGAATPDAMAEPMEMHANTRTYCVFDDASGEQLDEFTASDMPEALRIVARQVCSPKQKRQVKHIQQSAEEAGKSKNEAEAIVHATMNKESAVAVAAEIWADPESFDREAFVVGQDFSIRVSEQLGKSYEEATSPVYPGQPGPAVDLPEDGATLLTDNKKYKQKQQYSRPAVKKAVALTAEDVRQRVASFGLTRESIVDSVLDDKPVEVVGISIRANVVGDIEMRLSSGVVTCSMVEMDRAVDDFMAHVAAASLLENATPVEAPVQKLVYSVRPLFVVGCATCNNYDEYAMPDEPADVACGRCASITPAAAVAVQLEHSQAFPGYAIETQVPGKDAAQRKWNADRVFTAVKSIVASTDEPVYSDGMLRMVAWNADEPSIRRIEKVLADRFNMRADVAPMVMPNQPQAPGANLMQPPIAQPGAVPGTTAINFQQPVSPVAPKMSPVVQQSTPQQAPPTQMNQPQPGQQPRASKKQAQAKIPGWSAPEAEPAPLPDIEEPSEALNDVEPASGQVVLPPMALPTAVPAMTVEITDEQKKTIREVMRGLRERGLPKDLGVAQFGKEYSSFLEQFGEDTSPARQQIGAEICAAADEAWSRPTVLRMQGQRKADKTKSDPVEHARDKANENIKRKFNELPHTEKTTWKCGHRRQPGADYCPICKAMEGHEVTSGAVRQAAGMDPGKPKAQQPPAVRGIRPPEGDSTAGHGSWGPKGKPQAQHPPKGKFSDTKLGPGDKYSTPAWPSGGKPNANDPHKWQGTSFSNTDMSTGDPGHGNTPFSKRMDAVSKKAPSSIQSNTSPKQKKAEVAPAGQGWGEEL